MVYGWLVNSCQAPPVTGIAAACWAALRRASPETVRAGAVRSAAYWACWSARSPSADPPWPRTTLLWACCRAPAPFAPWLSLSATADRLSERTVADARAPARDSRHGRKSDMEPSHHSQPRPLAARAPQLLTPSAPTRADFAMITR